MTGGVSGTMKRRVDADRREYFTEALEGKRVPILTLDNKWYQLLTEEAREKASGLENELNSLLRQQGKLNNEVKDIKRLKKKLMSEIVSLMDEAGQEAETESAKQIDKNKKLVEECNERLEMRQDELLELPKRIEELNFQLMLVTMEYCYDAMRENEEEIREIADWVADIRVELKKRLIRKQEMEKHNNEIYAYMHDILGAEVIDVFDMQYVLEEEHSDT